MPRYYFNIHRPNNEVVPDDEGAEFATFAEAKLEAVHSARELTVNAIKDGFAVMGLSIQILDESGEVVDIVIPTETYR